MGVIYGWQSLGGGMGMALGGLARRPDLRPHRRLHHRDHAIRGVQLGGCGLYTLPRADPAHLGEAVERDRRALPATSTGSADD